MRFNGQTIFITGASSGLGEELGRRFFREGASLALFARRHEKLAALKAELESTTRPDQAVEIFPCDVSDFDETARAVDHLADAVGPPDLLINNAGILEEGYFEDLPLDSFRKVMEVNYLGVVNCTRLILPYMKKKGSGQIVNIASLGGKIPAFGYSAYCSSKYALVGLTETLRMELKPQNIKVCMACPGEFESPMVDRLNTYRTRENTAVAHTVPVLPVKFIAEEILSGIAKGRYLIIPGKTAKLVELASRLFPSMARSIVDFKLKRVYRGPKGNP